MGLIKTNIARLALWWIWSCPTVFDHLVIFKELFFITYIYIICILAFNKLLFFKFKAVTEDKCYEEGKGNTYLGKINVTETGYVCRRWDSEDVFVYQMFEHLENYCRSPDGAPFPWCLSKAPGKRWEKCQIPICGTFMLFLNFHQWSG